MTPQRPSGQRTRRARGRASPATSPGRSGARSAAWPGDRPSPPVRSAGSMLRGERQRGHHSSSHQPSESEAHRFRSWSTSTTCPQCSQARMAATELSLEDGRTVAADRLDPVALFRHQQVQVIDRQPLPTDPAPALRSAPATLLPVHGSSPKKSHTGGPAQSGDDDEHQAVTSPVCPSRHRDQSTACRKLDAACDRRTGAIPRVVE